MKKTHRLLPTVLALCIGGAGIVHSNAAQAALIGTEQLATSRSPQELRGPLFAALDRAEVKQALAERGVAPDELRERIAALTDAEAAQLAEQVESAPAGAADVIGYAVFVFVLLLVTDILGFTKIFPFTRAVR